MSSTPKSNKENRPIPGHGSSPKAVASKSTNTNTNTKSKSKSKSKTKPAPSNEEKTKKYFKSLLAQVEGGHFANAIKTCDKILRINEPSSMPEAVRTKVFCLLHLEKYTDALAALDSLSSASSSADSPGAGEQGIERAYALYRLGKEADVVLPLLDEGVRPNLGRGGLHLRAQLCYRKGMFEEAVSLYNELLDSCDINSEEYKDIENNLQASQQRLDFERTGFKAQLHTIDVLKLEEMPPPSDVTTSARPVATPASGAPAPTAPKAKKTKGEVKGLDPERWIKKSERESYRSTRRGAGASQGVRVK